MKQVVTYSATYSEIFYRAVCTEIIIVIINDNCTKCHFNLFYTHTLAHSDTFHLGAVLCIVTHLNNKAPWLWLLVYQQPYSDCSDSSSYNLLFVVNVGFYWIFFFVRFHLVCTLWSLRSYAHISIKLKFFCQRLSNFINTNFVAQFFFRCCCCWRMEI